jgi:hypothetical protein
MEAFQNLLLICKIAPAIFNEVRPSNAAGHMVALQYSTVWMHNTEHSHFLISYDNSYILTKSYLFKSGKTFTFFHG